MNTNFYKYTQNNVDSNFIINDRIGKIVYIEANNYFEANKFAIELGIEFSSGRWTRATGSMLDEYDMPERNSFCESIVYSMDGSYSVLEMKG